MAQKLSDVSSASYALFVTHMDAREIWKIIMNNNKFTETHRQQFLADWISNDSRFIPQKDPRTGIQRSGYIINSGDDQLVLGRDIQSPIKVSVAPRYNGISAATQAHIATINHELSDKVFGAFRDSVWDRISPILSNPSDLVKSVFQALFRLGVTLDLETKIGRGGKLLLMSNGVSLQSSCLEATLRINVLLRAFGGFPIIQERPSVFRFR